MFSKEIFDYFYHDSCKILLFYSWSLQETFGVKPRPSDATFRATFVASMSKANFEGWPNDATFEVQHLSSLLKRELESSYRLCFYGNYAHLYVFRLSCLLCACVPVAKVGRPGQTMQDQVGQCNNFDGFQM